MNHDNFVRPTISVRWLAERLSLLLGVLVLMRGPLPKNNTSPLRMCRGRGGGNKSWLPGFVINIDRGRFGWLVGRARGLLHITPHATVFDLLHHQLSLDAGNYDPIISEKRLT